MSDFWTEPCDLRLIPTCGVVSKTYAPPAKGVLLPNGKRPKGKWEFRMPIEKEWNRRFPSLSQKLGEYLYLQGAKRQSQYEYGLLISPSWPKMSLGLFQTRIHFDDPEDSYIIAQSYGLLHLWCIDHPGADVLLYPLGRVGQGYYSGMPRNVRVFV